MEEKKYLSDIQLDLLKNKVNLKREVTISELNLELKIMDSYEEYLEVRPITELVSRSNMYHSGDYIASMLSNPLYYPFILKSASKNNEKPKIVAYFEIYILPHLGRMFDSRLERVIVIPEYRKLGIFNYMITFAIDFCKSTLKCNRIDLIAENPIAMRIYERFEFEKVDTTLYRKYL
ncbi:hypothetical protein MACJ_003527 [Theileria orientalis]|uniref:N-acetyltransferase domain-containing protein n=1 Tax=Theileria orientalis TaxID=68886 RepID=A0A976SKJ0_THEOR|nr:hypothetical protein MACJ_003527 [Theileria orientalis]